ncbi:GNAT family N-acetyltransferase [Candidatus Bathyarchaeota archaeon]|nr:GNAT family N-acetyltransferase [Candidatus Bathyarchaeota archaeon]
MKPVSRVKITDITKNKRYERYLYRCLAPIPFRKYSRRQEYLENAIPKGFHKKLLIFNGKILGQIEYAPAGASYYPVTGENIIAMNCIWVLRKAKGHNLGKRLLKDMMESEENANGFATIGLENHWSPWLKKWQMEKLGFTSLDSITVTHKTKHKEQSFKIHLMWLPATENARPPTWNKTGLLEGVSFCLAHPLYRPQTWKGDIFEAK